MIIDYFSSILRSDHNVVEHTHFVCDKLCAFWAILFSFRFTIGLNTFIVARLEFFWYNRRLRTRIASGLFVSHLRSETNKSHIMRKTPKYLILWCFWKIVDIISLNFCCYQFNKLFFNALQIFLLRLCWDFKNKSLKKVCK